jgi:hypothetical protein
MDANDLYKLCLNIQQEVILEREEGRRRKSSLDYTLTTICCLLGAIIAQLYFK